MSDQAPGLSVPLVGVATLAKDPTSTSSAAGTPVPLKVVPLPRIPTGQGFRIRGWGRVANNANAKSVQIQIGGVTLVNVPITVSVANFWTIDVTVLNRGAGVFTIGGFGFQGPNTPGFATQVGDAFNVDLSAPQTLQFQATQVAAADITQTGITVEFLP